MTKKYEQIVFNGRGISFLTKPAIMIGLICLFGVSLRLYFFTPEIPLTLDAIGYFWYANDMSILGQFPKYPASNNGWPVFLSIFFSIFHFNNALDYMNLQKFVSLSLSVLTAIPIYLLCTRFFSKPYSVLGSLLFIIEPRIIQNSLFGITEPLYIFLLTTALFCFLSKNDKLVYLSFSVIALSTMVRSESLFVFFSFCVMYAIRYKSNKKWILKLFVAAIIFTLVLLPMVLIRIQTSGSDGITSRIVGGSSSITYENQEKGFSDIIIYFTNAIQNFVKFLGWSLIPFFIVFLPVGVFITLKKRNYENYTLFVVLILSSLPIFYAFIRSISETRYFLPLYPLFVILTIFTIKEISEKIHRRKTVLILFVIFLIISSMIFLQFKMQDVEHEKEALKIAKYVTKTAKVINHYYPEGKYLMVTKLLEVEKFPVLKTDVPPSVSILSIEGFTTIEEYMKFGQKEGLTHLILDGSKTNPSFLNEIFTEDKKYPYLTKIFDSSEHGYHYHVKIFQINYEKLVI